MPPQSNPDLIALLRNARDAIDAYLEQVTPAGAATDGSQAGAKSAPAARKERASRSAGSAPQFDEVRTYFIKQVIERTGYPEEMLELDLDLEGELGIDTVKQVAILGAVREHYGLDVDPSFKLRDHNTLRKAITHVAGRLQAG